MSLFIRSLFNLTLLYGLNNIASADVKEVSLNEILSQVEAKDPSIASANYREKAAQENIGVSKSNYLPTLSIEAIDSAGFPGSSSMAGVGGLMGSPYRSGLAAGVVGKQTIWDFGRTSSKVTLAEEESQGLHDDIKIKKLQIEENAIKVFFECSFYRSQMEVWKNLGEESAIVTKEVKKFVGTGQRSIVDSYLSQGQEEEAVTSVAEIKERLFATINHLKLLTGIEKEEITCPILQNEITQVKSISESNNILINKAEVESRIAIARVAAAKSGYMPELVAVGSVGTMENSRFVAEQNYSAAIGLTFPLFEGWKTSHEVSSARASLAAKNSELAAAKQGVSEMNIKFDENLNSARVRLEHLRSELQLAEKAFNTAKKRYLSLQGSLTDVREALRNLSRTQTQKNEALAVYFKNQKLRELFND
jgi:outer membrane protein